MGSGGEGSGEWGVGRPLRARRSAMLSRAVAGGDGGEKS
ncbi:hypothetical protein N44_03932 [Microcystis aeruginosa NIES-44]|uniref:Uncharacterized protein n=1 Tax=Microcystis aeruginosa NIES-44 TaxID=449439 RepID=A0A0A1VZ44_MICAE|nr:hypothetical protein N44_03932 [Microcystis aeruginosa NIES-44]